jgi:hypothetical protein
LRIAHVKTFYEILSPPLEGYQSIVTRASNSGFFEKPGKYAVYE